MTSVRLRLPLRGSCGLGCGFGRGHGSAVGRQRAGFGFVLQRAGFGFGPLRRKIPLVWRRVCLRGAVIVSCGRDWSAGVPLASAALALALLQYFLEPVVVQAVNEVAEFSPVFDAEDPAANCR